MVISLFLNTAIRNERMKRIAFLSFDWDYRVVPEYYLGLQECVKSFPDVQIVVFNAFGVNMIWYTITDWLGIVAILTAFLFSVAGLIQLLKRKSILKVDREILALGGLYLIVIGLYVLFENAVVNYRPLIMPDSSQPEASFPSSHTMLVCVIMGSAVMLTGRYIKNKPLCVLLKVFCALTIGITVIGRLISGVHWFTDILGGVMISAALLSLYSAIAFCNTNQDKYQR